MVKAFIKSCLVLSLTDGHKCVCTQTHADSALSTSFTRRKLYLNTVRVSSPRNLFQTVHTMHFHNSHSFPQATAANL